VLEAEEAAHQRVAFVGLQMETEQLWEDVPKSMRLSKRKGWRANNSASREGTGGCLPAQHVETLHWEDAPGQGAVVSAGWGLATRAKTAAATYAHTRNQGSI
jgi:hypothetical protein